MAAAGQAGRTFGMRCGFFSRYSSSFLHLRSAAGSAPGVNGGAARGNMSGTSKL